MNKAKRIMVKTMKRKTVRRASLRRLSGKKEISNSFKELLEDLALEQREQM